MVLLTFVTTETVMTHIHSLPQAMAKSTFIIYTASILFLSYMFTGCYFATIPYYWLSIVYTHCLPNISLYPPFWSCYNFLLLSVFLLLQFLWVQTDCIKGKCRWGLQTSCQFLQLKLVGKKKLVKHDSSIIWTNTPLYIKVHIMHD